MPDPTITLKRARAEVFLRYRHPWVYSKGLVQKPAYPAGSQVRVAAENGRHLGWAFYHPHNAISLRMISFEPKAMDEAAWRKRIAGALALRRRVLPADETCFRLIHGENDGFPGLTVDVYGDLLCMQVTSAGVELLKSEIASWLAEMTGARAVYERSEGYARKQEGLSPAKGFLIGETAFPMEIEEHGFRYPIDPAAHQKTGFYLDQRNQRAWVENQSRSRRVLDLCCYTGGFTMAALRGGATEVLSVDSSARALEWFEKTLTLNGFRSAHVHASVFDFLKRPVETPWDLVILDPPSLAKTAKTENNARKAYRQLHRDVSAWVKPGGLLVTFSCTGVVSAETFRQSVFLGLRDAGREALILQRFSAGPDHPVHLYFPEGEYLKGLALFLP